ncbi:MAG: hypothetical protein DRP47_05105 [Candidatus Zixiibacteriota bacterium]|nr:MAG: hypothetical protein DRP47_05105 [candidate division Zixibacteria bacterium]
MKTRPHKTVQALNENAVVALVQRGVVNDTFRRLSADKKQRIYQTAIDLFGKFGYDGLAVDQFCRVVGISKGSFFQYFPSKSHLLEFTILLFDNYLEKMFVEIRRTESGPLVRQKLSHLYDALVVNSRLYPEEENFYLFATQALKHSAITLHGIELERHIRGYVEKIIRRGEETGEIRGDFEVNMTGHLVSLIIGALVRSTFQNEEISLRDIDKYLISFLFDGIKQ